MSGVQLHDSGGEVVGHVAGGVGVTGGSGIGSPRFQGAASHSNRLAVPFLTRAYRYDHEAVDRLERLLGPNKVGTPGSDGRNGKDDNFSAAALPPAPGSLVIHPP